MSNTLELSGLNTDQSSGLNARVRYSHTGHSPTAELNQSTSISPECSIGCARQQVFAIPTLSLFTSLRSRHGTARLRETVPQVTVCWERDEEKSSRRRTASVSRAR
eukprot:5468106-Pleurochrysis_carterae.AAC.2